MKKLRLELVYWTIHWWGFFVINNMLFNECVCKKSHFLFDWFGYLHLLWLVSKKAFCAQSTCVQWVSAYVCYLTSSPFSPPGRHILKIPCGWSHVCSERLRETEHNSDLNNWITQTTHLPNQTFLDTWTIFILHWNQYNHFWLLMQSAHMDGTRHWPLEWYSGNWWQNKALYLRGLLSSSLIHILNMQHWVLNSAQASRSLKITVNLLR